MTKAIALCRVSTKGQADDGHSLDHQATSVSKMADILEAEIVQTWSLNVSSKKGCNLKRKDLTAALQYCRYNRGVKYVLIDTVSRFMRELEMIFYFKVEFKKLGVKVVFCDPEQHELNGDNAQASKALADWAYQAERENEVRAHTSKVKMQQRIRDGYYPFYPHQGYKRTDARDGLHVPDEPRYGMLKHVLKELAALRMTVDEAVRWLDVHDYTTRAGKRLSQHRLREIMIDSYYAGILDISGWEGPFHGLHEAMISADELAINVLVAQNKKLRIKLQFNPKYRLNKAFHNTCIDSDGKVTGILHENGKGWSRHEYVCRSCKKRVPVELVHDSMTDILSRIELKPEYRSSLVTELERVWHSNESFRTDKAKSLSLLRSKLVQKKLDLVGAVATNPCIADDIIEAVNKAKRDISIVDKQLIELQSIEKEYHNFLRFALDYVERLRSKWWNLDADNFGQCKKLIFNDEILIDLKGKVYTPNISPIYTLANKNDDPKVVENAKLVELAGTAPASAGLSWSFVYRHSSLFGLSARVSK